MIPYCASVARGAAPVTRLPAKLWKHMSAPQTTVESSASDFAERFGGLARLFGRAGLERLRAALCVVGVGGVGSWVVEALARSGVGALTLIDLDDVCVTNVNRQLPALDGQIDRSARKSTCSPSASFDPTRMSRRAGGPIFSPRRMRPICSQRDSTSSSMRSIRLTNKCVLISGCRERPIAGAPRCGRCRWPTRWNGGSRD